MNMKLPKMVFFDFGGTIVDDKPFNVDRAGRALYACADNREACSEDKAAAVWTEIFNTACRKSHLDGVPMEIPPMSNMIRCALDCAGLSSSLSSTELETAVQWQGDHHPLMESIDKAIDMLNELGIRTAVISNFSISSATLTARINKLLPRHRFEFIITSSDYAYCKPCSLFFEAALGKAGVDARNCWYCGNDFNADVVGAFGCGMFPVLLDRRAEKDVSLDTCEMGEFLRISSWNDFLRLQCFQG